MLVFTPKFFILHLVMAKKLLHCLQQSWLSNVDNTTRVEHLEQLKSHLTELERQVIFVCNNFFSCKIYPFIAFKVWTNHFLLYSQKMRCPKLYTCFACIFI